MANAFRTDRNIMLGFTIAFSIHLGKGDFITKYQARCLYKQKMPQNLTSAASSIDISHIIYDQSV